MSSKASSLSIVIPVFNETNNVEGTLRALFEKVIDYNFEIVVVDDGSTDSSLEVLESLQIDLDFKLTRHKVNKGYGAAIKSGIDNAVGRYILTFDADGQHDLDEIFKIYDFTVENDADMVVGRRIKYHSSVFKTIGRTAIRVLSKILIPNSIKDINTGFKIYRRDLAKKYLSYCPDSMAFSDVILFSFLYHRDLVLEKDIVIHQRKSGKSKVNIGSAFSTIIETLNILVLFNPMRLFLPVSLLFLTFGMVWGGVIIAEGRGLSSAALFSLISGILIFLFGLLAEQMGALRRKR